MKTLSIVCSKGTIQLLLLLLFPLFLTGQRTDPVEGLKKLQIALQIINYAYVDTVHEDELVKTAIVEMLKELDPHSIYIPKEELQRANEPLQGNFEGVGIQFEILKDTIIVVHPLPGGPSEKLGIISGDKIVKIDGEDVVGKHINNQFVLDHLRGKRGTKVQVSIYRRGKKGLLDYTIVRDKIPINSIDAVYMIAPGIGYINCNRFSLTTTDEFQDAVKKLKGEGMNSLILDLRNNAGGYMAPAIELSDEFLGLGKIIVYTEGMRSKRENFYSTFRGNFEHGKVVIMINENSASSSEIVAGAIQDWDRGLIVGRRSFGKGLVQRPYNLPDSSQIRLTTARYHTPSGRYIQKPYQDGIEEYYMDFTNRYRRGELVHADSIKLPDSLKYQTAGGRTVYGGGGIMPDVFIPWDSTFLTDYYLDVRRNNIINPLVGEYVDKHRQELLKRYPDCTSFKTNFEVDEPLMELFFKAAGEADMEMNEEEFTISEPLINVQIKGLIAQKLWDITSYYIIAHELDPEVMRAVEIIQDEPLFQELSD
ncbi:MAG: S41 family peptidase [Bacteroidales bacterium]|nr:S41 family peptidase [Bacteroidales bacterium]